MYFFNALTAVAKGGKEQGGKNLLRGGGGSCLWLLWHPWQCSTLFSSSSLGVEISGIHLAKNVWEPTSVSSILNNVSGLQSDGVPPTFCHTRAWGKEKRRIEDSEPSIYCKKIKDLCSPRCGDGWDILSLSKKLCLKNCMSDLNSGVT